MQSNDDAVVLDLTQTEPEDGPELARLVTWIRELARHHPVVLVGAPQMLAHTLYKAGLLRSGRIALKNPRVEEPYG